MVKFSIVVPCYKDLFLKLKVIDRKTQILGKPVATESDNNSYNFIICQLYLCLPFYAV